MANNFREFQRVLSQLMHGKLAPAARMAFHLPCKPLATVCWTACLIGVLGNYQMGDPAPMCWQLPHNQNIACPPDLQLDWLPGHKPPDVMFVGGTYRSKVKVGVSENTFRYLHNRGMLSNSLPNITAEQQWAACTQGQAKCTNVQPHECCYFHVNVHSCLNKPGSFCAPWVKNDGYLATHTPSQTGQAGRNGAREFDFNITLFWEGSYTVIAHIKMAGMHFAIGTTSEVTLASQQCETHQVPKMTGGCEMCGDGWQSKSLGIPFGAVQLSDAEALRTGKNVFCIGCPRGRHSAKCLECKLCQPGTFQSNETSKDCDACPEGAFSAGLGETKCSLCSVGTFQAQVGRTSCMVCPEGASCEPMMGSVYRGSAVAKVGWYRFAGNIFQQCGGNACLGNNTCAQVSEGPQCAVCSPGYARLAENASCTQCSSSYVLFLLGILVALAYTLYIWSIVKNKRKACKPDADRASISILQKIFINYLFLATRAMDVSTTLKALKWSSSATGAASFLENPIFTIVHPYCVLDRDRAEEVVLYCAFIFLPTLFILTFFGMVFNRQVQQHWGAPRGNFRLFVLRTLLPTLVVQSFIFHPVITSTFIKFAVRCKRMDVSVLWVNPYIKCGEREQMQLFRTGLAGIFVYSVGIPVAFWVLLYRYRNKLMRHDVRIVLGFLYDGYAHRFYYSECIIMLRKVFIDFLANFEGPHATTPAERAKHVLMRFVLVGFGSLSIMFWAHPYEKRQFQIYDRVEYASIVVFTCTAALDLAAQLESPGSKPEKSVGVTIAFTIMSMHLYFLLLFFWALSRNWLVRKVRSRPAFWRAPHHHPQKCHERVLSVGGLQIGMDGKLDLSALKAFELRAMHRVLVDVTRCVLQSVASFQVHHISDFVQTAFSSVIRRRLSASISGNQLSHQESMGTLRGHAWLHMCQTSSTACRTRKQTTMRTITPTRSQCKNI